MSLTGPDHLFAGVHEDGVNDLLRAFFGARPHHLRYGSPPFVTATTVTETLVDPIPFPGTAGGIGWHVEFGVPIVDFYPDSSGGALPAPLTLGTGQLSVHTHVRLCVQCGRRRKGREPGRDFIPICTELDLWAIGEPVGRYYGSPGSGDVSFQLDAVELVDIAPDTLESVLECVIRMMLQAVLDGTRLPFHALTAGAFSLALTRGPEVSDDMLKLWGTP